MFDGGLVIAFLAYAIWAARRATRGPAPLAPIRLTRLAAGCVLINLGFHAAATAAPSAMSAIVLVLAGWTTFGLWWKWLSRAPAARRRPDDGEDGGGGPGHGDDPPPIGPAGPAGDEDIDWDAFDREFAAYLEQRERPLATD